MREDAGVIRDLLEQASKLREAGRYGEAEDAYKRVLALDPNQATCWYNLGFVQRQQGRFDEALASYEQALQRGVSAPEEVHLNRAVIYADHLRREDKAEHELNAALKRSPRYAPALFNLANLKEDRGHRAAAMALYEQVLAIAPNACEALARLAQIAPAALGDAMIGRVRGALASPQIKLADRASLGFALGRLLDQAGEYDAAFEAYAEANRASKASAQGQAAYDPAAEERLIDAIIEAFPSAQVGSAGEGRAPIFICGMFRSGSTLTEQVLAGHPRVSAGGELDLLPAMAREIGFPGRVIGDDEAKALARRYRDRLSQLFPTAEFVTDKRPDNFLYIGLIKRLFPDAKIVHTIRRPLDNLLSLYFLHLDHSMAYALDLMDAAHHYRQYRRLMAHWKRLYGPDIFEFDYDVFVREPRGSVARLLAFLGLDWSEECLTFERRTNVVKTASVWQVREPLYQRSSGRWRNYERQVQPVRAALADLIGAD